MDVLYLLPIAFLAPFAIALASFPFLRIHKGANWGLALFICLAIILSPCLLPIDRPLLRLLAAISAVMTAIKVIDTWLDATFRATPDWEEYLAFLANPFVYVRRYLSRERRLTWRINIMRLALGSLGCALGVALSEFLFRVDWHGMPFFAEHASKVIAFMLAVIGGLEAATALWRLLGGTARDYMDNPLAARTPAEFWRRYNRNMHQFFWQDIFKPAGGFHSPVRTTLLIFAISAAMHEFIFSIAIGRVQGYQTAFFLMQGVAVALTAGVKVKGWVALPWTVGTLAFNLASSVLFFASIHTIVPFYSGGLPAWLQRY